MDAATYLISVASKADDFNPFNLLVFDGLQLLGLESRHRHIVSIKPGTGAVSNADFDTPWPKLQRLKQGLTAQLQSGKLEISDLLPLLQDTTVADDSELPHTGISPEWERLLSAIRVRSEAYGTRVSSVIRLGRDNVDFSNNATTPAALEAPHNRQPR